MSDTIYLIPKYAVKFNGNFTCTKTLAFGYMKGRFELLIPKMDQKGPYNLGKVGFRI